MAVCWKVVSGVWVGVKMWNKSVNKTNGNENRNGNGNGLVHITNNP